MCRELVRKKSQDGFYNEQGAAELPGRYSRNSRLFEIYKRLESNRSIRDRNKIHVQTNFNRAPSESPSTAPSPPPRSPPLSG
jgi:hypothetical protein